MIKIFTKTILAIKIPIILFIIFWAIGIILNIVLNNSFYIFNFGFIGTSLGLGIGTYTLLPRKNKHLGRKLAQFLVGAYMFIFLGLISFENMQIEGFFLYILSGIFAGSTIHYLVAKIAGPLIFNRGWCGWACWTAAILDLLPFQKNKSGRLPNAGFFRILHFALSLLLILVLWFLFDYRIEEGSRIEVYWLLAGNALYYASAILLAYYLKDNRAFCKYLCPIPVIQKIPAKFSLLKIEAQFEDCTNCSACARNCPMDIDIPQYIQDRQRVLSSECILCFQCVDACPQSILDTTFKLDFSLKEHLILKK
ncbi:MAG: 4Fe-4S binding protein [Anaerolineaceae bacterium]|nr:4Fe-4S binding protein [Anaerolineaceae bacterium]